VDINGDVGFDTTVTVGGETVTGNYALANGADVIVATNGADISGVNTGAATTAENLTLTGAITMTEAQHEAFTITALGGTDEVTITTAGAVTAAVGIETYNVSSGGSNDVTVNAAELAVDINGDVGFATTVTVGGETVTGDYALASGADVIVATNGADISGVNTGAATTAENLTLTGAITMTEAQYVPFIGNIIAGGGADSITFTDAVTTARTLDAAVETFVLGDFTNSVTSGAGGQTINADAQADGVVLTLAGTHNVTVSLVAGDLTSISTGNITVTATTGSNVITTGAGLDTISGGDGDDIITGGAFVDTIDVGAGTDKVVIGTVDAAGIDIITGFTNNDTISFVGAASYIVDLNNLEGFATLDLALADVLFGWSGNPQPAAIGFTYRGDTYVVLDGNGSGAYEANFDGVAQLIGTNLGSLSAANFVA
jgi:hypothetical protein